MMGRSRLGGLLAGLVVWPLIFIATIAGGAADQAASITQTYNAPESVLPGMLVAPDVSAQTTVTALTKDNLPHMLGVVVAPNDAPLVLSSSATGSQQVLVANSGRYNILISNQNGAIKVGDYLTISNVAGIAMKADASEPEIVGQALSSFNGSSGVIGSVPLKSGKRQITVGIGSVQAIVHLISNPAYVRSTSHLPAWLGSAAKTVTNKPISAARIYLAAFMILLAAFITASLFFSGVRGSIVAVGRNPLAKKTIGRSLLIVLMVGIGILVLGAVLAYLILKL